eukprot:TRINITY_DN24279_c0_g1_i1.p1 TRINITY_DN24279_c0_g1~~TRINITY_DN24279_c0_g1_i1.p1  ORF type:complete len:186 (-),score=26.61 TRINITY_DN24279_c0_g1_i1:283-768(-)
MAAVRKMRGASMLPSGSTNDAPQRTADASEAMLTLPRLPYNNVEGTYVRATSKSSNGTRAPDSFLSKSVNTLLQLPDPSEFFSVNTLEELSDLGEDFQEDDSDDLAHDGEVSAVQLIFDTDSDEEDLMPVQRRDSPTKEFPMPFDYLSPKEYVAIVGTLAG